MKETKSQNQQACQKKKYTSHNNENIVCRRKHHLMRERVTVPSSGKIPILLLFG
jgi:hypothetical protein